MARLPRLVVPGLPHLIVHRGQNRQAVVLDDADRSLLIQALRQCAAEAQVAVHAYALQPAELRLLATPPREAALAEMMQALGRRYVRAFNLKHGRSGTPWEGRFRSTVVEPGSFLLPAMLVVESSGAPGTAIASEREAPAWSSAAHHLGLRADPLVTEHAAFWRLGNTPFEREAAYRQLLGSGLPALETERILDAARKGWALGTLAFAAQVGAQTGRRAAPTARGRPRIAAEKARQLI